MSIYTRTGDKGTTSLFGGKRVYKSDPQVEAYGSVDELNSFIGLAISKSKNKEEKAFLTSIQQDLYIIMSYLSGAKVNLKSIGIKVARFEKEIDKIEKLLPKLSLFILPGGNEISSWFHILRVICRRAERNVVRISSNYEPRTTNYELILKYLNRLSDLFFILARWHNKDKEKLY
ncbi:cob(I)yrinic acid a,c-diamide adenosyltransferase [Candidatus Roizmanbacteria bacterium]|nr:cob(I)yrinic acid a,c-diamide adenosyltransferase [Candidatus Roizmanbacteria bacterium]